MTEITAEQELRIIWGFSHFDGIGDELRISDPPQEWLEMVQLGLLRHRMELDSYEITKDGFKFLDEHQSCKESQSNAIFKGFQ